MLYFEDFGCVGDGVTDDAVNMQKALNALTPGGVLVSSPGRTFLFGTALKWPNVAGATIIGHGSTWKLKAGANSDLMTSYNYPSTGGGASPVCIGLTIDGNSANNTGSGSFVFYGINGGRFTDVKIKSVEGVGLFLRKCTDWKFNSCDVTDSGASGFCAYDDSHEVYWNNCNAVRCAPGFLLQGPEVTGQLKSTGLHINGGSALDSINGQSGVQIIQGVEGFGVKGMRIRGNAGRGVDVYSAVNGSLISSSLMPNKNGIISGNDISNNAADEGIKISDDTTAGKGAVNIIVSNNRCYDDQTTKTQGYGIVIQTLADYISIRNNDVTGNLNSGIISGGTGTNIKIEQNTGYVTEKSGKATGVSSTGTFAHGLGGTPSTISVTPASAGVTDLTTAVDNTNVTVTFGGGGAKDFFWSAKL